MNARQNHVGHKQSSVRANASTPQRSLFDAEPWYQEATQLNCAGPAAGAQRERVKPQNSELADQQSLHLQAARRLSKAIRAQKADRNQQAKTGKAICQHLLALLAANETQSEAQNAAQNEASEDPKAHA